MFLEVENWRMAFVYGAAAFLIIFVFQAIALYTIATRNGFAHKWMAFIPVLSTFYIGMCSRKNKALGLDSKLVGIIVASLEFVVCAGYIMHYIGHHFAQNYIDYDVIEIYGVQFQEAHIAWGRIPAEIIWAGFCFETLSDILDFVNLIYLFAQVMLLAVFFQTYASRRYFLFTIISVIFPVQGILFFAVRKNAGMNYREYLMREQERRYRMYRQYTQDNRYNQNGYNQNGSGENPYSYKDPRQDTKHEDPFEEFGSSDDDPFIN